jgi:hypothetical protein
VKRTLFKAFKNFLIKFKSNLKKKLYETIKMHNFFINSIYKTSNLKGIFISATIASLIPQNAEATNSPNSRNLILVKVKKKRLVYKIKEDPSLVRAAEEALNNVDVQKDVNYLEQQVSKGNKNPGIGRKPICKGVTEDRGKNGG